MTGIGGTPLDREITMVVFYGFIFVAMFLIMWWITIMEGARHRQLNREAVRDAAVEYKREKEEGKIRIKKKKQLEYIRKRDAKKKRRKKK